MFGPGSFDGQRVVVQDDVRRHELREAGHRAPASRPSETSSTPTEGMDTAPWPVVGNGSGTVLAGTSTDGSGTEVTDGCRGGAP